jgi:hypothetical protein
MQDWQGPASTDSLENMLLWGETSGADALCWLTLGDAPDEWPVAVWKRHGGWALYHCGMVEFLLRVFRAELDACPFSDASLWGETAPRFLHAREEQRLREAGIDPWTGAPDPLADLGFD